MPTARAVIKSENGSSTNKICICRNLSEEGVPDELQETNVSARNKQRQHKRMRWTSAYPKQVSSLGRRGGIHGIG